MTTRRYVLKAAMGAAASLCIPRAVVAATGAKGFEQKVQSILQPLLVGNHLTSEDTQTHLVEHSFLLDGFRRYANMAPCFYIVQNGGPKYEHEDWYTVDGPTLRTAVYANAEMGEVSISTDQLRAILTGAVTNWSEVGLRDMPIKLAVRAHEQIFLAQRYMKRYAATIDPSKRIYDLFRYAEKHHTYDDLLAFAQEEPGALVIGLRDVKPENLTPVKLDGAAFNATGDYSLKMQTFISVRRDEDKLALVQSIVSKVIKNRDRDARYLSTMNFV